MDQRLYSGESSRYCTVDAAALPDKMLMWQSKSNLKHSCAKILVGEAHADAHAYARNGTGPRLPTATFFGRWRMAYFTLCTQSW